MDKRPLVVTSLLLSGLLAAPSTALAAQMTARDRPVVRGPLRQEIRRCRSREVRFEGRVIAEARSCIRLYRLRPGVDNHSARDYGAVWLQATLDPRRRWCAEKVRSDVDVPDGTRMHNRAPRSRFTDRRRRVRTRLVVDARGRADRRGVIRQGYALLPRALRTSTRSDGRLWRAVWRGSTDATVAIATGIEISWPAGEPPDRVSSNLAYRLQRKASC